jgi:heme a synthase
MLRSVSNNLRNSNHLLGRHIRSTNNASRNQCFLINTNIKHQQSNRKYMLCRSYMKHFNIERRVKGKKYYCDAGIKRGCNYVKNLQLNSVRKVKDKRYKSTQSISINNNAGKARNGNLFNTAPSASNTIPRDPLLATWIFGTGAMVFGMVTLGGATRLTRSGLSMVDWRPEGRKLPSTDEEWAVEFEKYKQFPEYQKLNKGMSISEFKEIYFMEWAHRMWGRAIGLVFAGPMVAFALAGRIPKSLYSRTALLLTMGGTQGFVGWWMVRSGLTHEHVFGIERSEYDTPRVSPYRLAAHLSMAFATYGVLMWTGFDLFRKMEGDFSVTNIKPFKQLSSTAQQALRKFKFKSKIGTSVLGLTVLSGAFVAGNDAGHAYNDWPYYAGEIIPEQIWMDNIGVRNVFENTALVQFDHRMLAYATLTTVGGLACSARFNHATWKILQPATKRALLAMTGVTLAQVSLGIATLMMYVPVELGVAHQGGALTLWTCGLWLLHTLKYVR